MYIETTPSRSVAGRFHRALLLTYLVSVVAVIPVIYFLTKYELYAQADKELKLLTDVIGPTGATVKEKGGPYILAKAELGSPTQPAAAARPDIAPPHFGTFQASYFVRMVSDNPLNERNLPDEQESLVLENLRHGNANEGIVQTTRIRGRSYLVSALPTKVHDDCLMCHGDPANVPTEFKTRYGTAGGFGWKPGTITGATLVGVPIADIGTTVQNRAGIAIGLITALFAGVLLVLNRVLERNITYRIRRLTLAAEAIACGESNEALASSRDDEIAALTRACELMRRSINTANAHIARLKKVHADNKGN
jgi:HAMP domain-containing protein